MIRLAACDLDGTIVDASGNCDPSVARTVKRLRENGIRFAICTGRPVGSIMHLLKHWRLDGITDYIIGTGGGEVYDCASGKTEKFFTLEPEVILEIIDLYEPLGLIPTWYRGKDLFVQKKTADTERVGRRAYVDVYEADVRSLIAQPEIKEMFVLDPALMEKTEAFYQNHQDSRYVGFKTAFDLFEFNHPSLSKHVGLKAVGEMMNITPDEMIAFGDTTNDLEMLKYVKYGICMASGTVDAKAAAFDVAGSVGEQGFAEYCSRHLKTNIFE